MYGNRFGARSLIPPGVAMYNYIKGLSKSTRDPTGLRYLPRTSTKSKRKSRAPISFKKALVSASPAYHCTGEVAQAAMTHNTMYTWLPTTLPTQGTGNQNRQGDSIDLVGLKLKGFFQTTTTSNAYTFRILIGWTGEEYNLTNFGAGGLTNTEVFQPGTASSWYTDGLVNAKAFTALYDQTIDVPSLVATVVDLKSWDAYVPLNIRFPYQSSAAIYGKNKNLAVVIIGCVQGGTAGTTVAGAGYISYDLIFKNN